MSTEELRTRASTLASRAIGGADLDKLTAGRNALLGGLIDALIAYSPKREIIDVRELHHQLDRLTGANVDYTQRSHVVRNALDWITTLLDRLDAPRAQGARRWPI